MAFNEELARDLKQTFELRGITVTSKKMFGGIAFLYQGKMTVGIINDDLMVRVISEKMEKVLATDGVRPMDFTGKAMKEFVFVVSEFYKTHKQLDFWITLGLEHAKNKLKN